MDDAEEIPVADRATVPERVAITMRRGLDRDPLAREIESGPTARTRIEPLPDPRAGCYPLAPSRRGAL